MQEYDFKNLLKRKGYKVTLGRLALLQVLWRESKPLSVRGILKKMGETMDEATIYRALEAFVSSGIIRRIDFGHSHAHYEFEKTHHHHLVCTDCGLVEDVMSCTVPPLSPAIMRRSKFKTIYSHNLEFFGRCITCTK